MKVGDLVEAVPPFVLRSGSGWYRHAVVVAAKPLVLVSVEGDMLWRATLYPGCVRAIGTPTPEAFRRAMDRYAREVRSRLALKQESPPEKGSGGVE